MYLIALCHFERCCEWHSDFNDAIHTAYQDACTKLNERYSVAFGLINRYYSFEHEESTMKQLDIL